MERDALRAELVDGITHLLGWRRWLTARQMDVLEAQREVYRRSDAAVDELLAELNRPRRAA